MDTAKQPIRLVEPDMRLGCRRIGMTGLLMICSATFSVIGSLHPEGAKRRLSLIQACR
jgi:hypothetical protein